MNMVNDEKESEYRTTDDDIIAKAIEILYSRIRNVGDLMNSPTVVKNFLRCKLIGYEHEVFSVLFMDTKHRVIKYEELFRGTLTQTNVHPREVVKRALQLNACAVILAHNHPSGVAEPSEADRRITKALKDALGLIDIRVLDHIIIAGRDTYSFAENCDI